MSHKRHLITPVSVGNSSVQARWRQLDEPALKKLRADTEAAMRQENLYQWLGLLAVPAGAALMYGILTLLFEADWLAAALFGLVLALIAISEVLDYQAKKSRPLQDLKYLLTSLEEPRYSGSCSEMLAFAKRIPACEAYRREVLSKGRGFLVADFYVMRQLHREGVAGFSLTAFRTLSEYDLEDCFAGM